MLCHCCLVHDDRINSRPVIYVSMSIMRDTGRAKEMANKSELQIGGPFSDIVKNNGKDGTQLDNHKRQQECDGLEIPCFGWHEYRA